MVLCAELATIFAVWVAFAMAPSAAIFGGLAWLGWRHARRWASGALGALALAGTVASAALFRADPEGIVIIAAFAALTLAAAASWLWPRRPTRLIALVAAALPALGVLAYILTELSASSCHTV